jgi:hypothetical protein
MRARALLQIYYEQNEQHVTDKERSRNSSLSRIPTTNQTVGVLFPVGEPRSDWVAIADSVKTATM